MVNFHNYQDQWWILIDPFLNVPRKVLPTRKQIQVACKKSTGSETLLKDLSLFFSWQVNLLFQPMSGEVTSLSPPNVGSISNFFLIYFISSLIPPPPPHNLFDHRKNMTRKLRYQRFRRCTTDPPV